MIYIRQNVDGTYDLVNLGRHEMLALRDAIRRSTVPLVAETLPDLVEEIEKVVPFSAAEV